MFLKPYPLLCIVGKVVRPELIVNPETAIDTGEDDLENPDNLPQEIFPTIDPVVARPTTEVVDKMLQVTTPTEELNALTL